MKKTCSMHFLGVFLFPCLVFSAEKPAQTFFGKQSDPSTTKFQQGLSDNEVWRGSWEDLKRTAEEWQRANVSEAVATRDVYRATGRPVDVSQAVDVSRNALMLAPVNRSEMEKDNEGTRELLFSAKEPCSYGDSWHQGVRGGNTITKPLNCWWQYRESAPPNVVYRSAQGPEVTYNRQTGVLVLDGNMGTYDFADADSHPWNHKTMDVDPFTNSSKDDGKKMMYAGIFWETDANNPNLFYIVDGQTGQRLTRKEVRETPVTINPQFEMCWGNERYQRQTMSDEERQALGINWQAEQKPTSSSAESLQNVQANSDQTAPVAQTPPALANSTPASQVASAQAYETIDYRPVKNWASSTINDAYSQATGIADSEGFGAEYRSMVSPIVNQSLNYIQSIPDQVQVPAGQ